MQSKGLSGVFSNTTVQKHQFFGAQLSSQSNSHIHNMTTGKTIALTSRHLNTVLEVGRPRSRCGQGEFLLRPLSWVADGRLLPGSSAGHSVHHGPGVSLCFKNTRQIALGPLEGLIVTESPFTDPYPNSVSFRGVSVQDHN